MLNIPSNLLNKDKLLITVSVKYLLLKFVSFFVLFFVLMFFFFRTEADEYIHMGALNGLFVLGRSVGFIGESSIIYVHC